MFKIVTGAKASLCPNVDRRMHDYVCAVRSVRAYHLICQHDKLPLVIVMTVLKVSIASLQSFNVDNDDSFMLMIITTLLVIIINLLYVRKHTNKGSTTIFPIYHKSYQTALSASSP